jgi:NAD(P)-dependent dehydrogenase (short-subunit alcohol dehydrogenase family)
MNDSNLKAAITAPVGRVVVVTGAAQGIGAACAERFAQDGSRVCMLDIDDAKGEHLALQLAKRGLHVSYVRCDVGRKTDIDSAVASIVEQFGRIDVLANVAGTFRAAEFLDITEEDFDLVLRVNLKGSFLMAQAVARQMVKQVPLGGQRGAIVNMSSVNAVLAIPTIASYNMSKGGVNQLTRAMALALADHGIRVNAVAPGTIATELAARAVLQDDAARNKILSRTPLRRLGEPAEVAEAVAWLASSAASYITGEILTVDGGRMALNYTVPL